MKQLSNQTIAGILYEMASLYKIKGVDFKPQAYERAALNIESLAEDIASLYQNGGRKSLDDIPGVGSGIARHIEELLRIGHFREYDQLKREIPIKTGELTAVEGIGPQTVKRLWQELGVKDLSDLEQAVTQGRIRDLKGFGSKSEAKIKKGIEFLKSSSGRAVLGFIAPDMEKLEQNIKNFPEVDRVVIAGSARRRKETIGDIDILVTSKQPLKVMDRFVKLEAVTHVYGKGETKTNVRLNNNLDADLRVVPAKSWGAAMCYFTGSKDHNIELRNIAIKKHWKLNEYGLFSGTRQLAGKSEQELYARLGLAYIEPELRENRGEIAAARSGKLPKLIGYDDLKGDLQIQTNWTDGRHSINEMALAAEDRGLNYIVITDHTRSLAMANGLDEKRLRRQMAEIDKLNDKLRRENRKINVLKGAEVNIMKDGSLDIKDAVLSELDVVGAAVHSHFELARKEQTQRLVRAMENPHIDIIFHLTTRLINRRQAIALDIDTIINTARQTGIVMEVDAYPDRLDISDDLVKRFIDAGVKIAIDSDAHAKSHYDYLRFGIAQARRGWAEKKDVINCWPLKKMLGFLK